MISSLVSFPNFSRKHFTEHPRSAQFCAKYQEYHDQQRLTSPSLKAG